MKVGLDHWTIHHREDLTGIGLLELVRSFDLDGLQFGDVRQVSPTLDRGELREVAAYARQYDMYVEVGIPSPNPHLDNALVLRDGDGDLRRGLNRHLAAIAEAAVDNRAVRCFVGSPGDRHTRPVSWPQQVADTIAVVRDLIPTLRDHGLRLAFENHADATIDDLVRIVAAIGSDVAGICLDTGNLLITLDDPLPAAARAASMTIATHFKDGIVTFDENGLVFNARPCGQGVLPLADILSELVGHNPNLVLSIEDHDGLYPIPIFGDLYLATFPGLSTGDLARVVETAWTCERRIAAGHMEDPAVAEMTPWALRAEDRIRAGGAYVRELVSGLGLRSDATSEPPTFRSAVGRA